MCHPCRDCYDEEAIKSITDDPSQGTTELPDGTVVCQRHSLEECEVCMMDFSLPNLYTLKRNELGRELTKEETDGIAEKWQRSSGIRTSRKICILDGQAVRPRSNQKLRCPRKEVTYCSKACQKHHCTIHKMTCKFQAEKLKKKAESADKRVAAAASALTEEQKNVARAEAFTRENNGRKGAIEECAWQLGEHPFAIGGGSIKIRRDGEEFIKGDVAKIFRDRSTEWDGSPRFGLRPYVSMSNPNDWIAVARRGKSQRMKDMENNLRGRTDS